MREGLVVPQRRDGVDWFSAGDAEVLRSGLRLLELGFPLPDLLALAKRHHDATRAIANDAVELFDEYVRRPLRDEPLTDDERAERLVEAFRTLLPTVTALANQHFRNTLLEVAQEHLESVGGTADPTSPTHATTRRTTTRWRTAAVTVLGPHGALPRGDEKRRSVEAMFDRVAPTYERTNRVISLGLDRRWRETAMVTLGLARNSRVLDVACGTGDFCRDLADTGHLAVGIDVSAGMLAAAHTAAPLVRGDVVALPSPDGAFDGVTCGFALRNFVALDVVLRECARVLRRGGRFVALDATVPTNPVMRFGNALWFRGAVPCSDGCSRATPTRTGTSRSRPRTFRRADALMDDARATPASATSTSGC